MFFSYSLIFTAKYQQKGCIAPNSLEQQHTRVCSYQRSPIFCESFPLTFDQMVSFSHYVGIPLQQHQCVCAGEQILKLLSMSQDIELFEICDKEQPIGTEIFDANLPSNIDFDHEIEHEHIEAVPFNPQKVSRLGKVITIGYEMKSYRVLGKVNALKEPLYFKGALVKSHMQTFAVKLFDEATSGGLKKFWESLLGYSKREIAVVDGYIYVLQANKEGRLLHQVYNLGQLFKIFIDPEQDKIRLVFQEGGQLLNKDISPDHYILFLEHLMQEVSKIGLGLSE